MPIQQPQWTEYLSCPICCNMFDEVDHRPISLGCGHTICKSCLCNLQQKKCPFDQNAITRSADQLPVNFALLQLIGVAVPELGEEVKDTSRLHYYEAKGCIEKLAIYLKPVTPTASGVANSMAPSSNSVLSRPMQRKLVALVNCQLVEEEGRMRAMRAARSLGERSVTELILLHQNPQQLSTNLWAAVRARGCQYLGPAMQEEVLKLILLALEDGSALSRKVLVLFVVQRLETQYPQASKTAIGHVVQLLYRASCFKVTKREEESSLMQLKDEFRNYEALRREHDAQIVQIASEAGLRISPEQWSSLLYGDTGHKSHMQSIIDKLQTPHSFGQSVNELMIALQRTEDKYKLSSLRPHLDVLARVNPSLDAPVCEWEEAELTLKAVCQVVQSLVEFIQLRTIAAGTESYRNNTESSSLVPQTKFKTSMCRDMAQTGRCPRASSCTFAHSQEELERYRARSKRFSKPGGHNSNPGLKGMTSSSLTPQEQSDLAAITQSAQVKLKARGMDGADADIMYRLVDVCEKEEAVRVPVAQPGNLPINKSARQPIYMLLSHSTTQQHPDIVPSACKAPGYTPLPVTQMKEPGVSSSPTPHLCGGQSHCARPREPGYHVAPTQVKSRGKSPSQKLEELHKRRTELLSQLTSPLPTGRPPDNGSEEPSNLHDIKLDTPLMMSTPSPDACQRMPPSVTGIQVTRPMPRVNNVVIVNSQPHHVDQAFGTTPLGDNCHCAHVRESSSFVSQGFVHQTDSSAHVSQNSAFTSLGSTHVSLDSTQQNIQMLYEVEAKFETSVMQEACVSSPSDVLGMKSNKVAATVDEDIHISSAGYQLWSAAEESHQEVPSVSSLYQKPAAETHSLTPPLDFSELNWGGLNPDDDEFVPFEANTVSKYGPISREVRAKTGNTAPLQVTAAQQIPYNTVQVNTISALQRPYPITGEIPSRFVVPQDVGGPFTGAAAPGRTIAASLPTAMMSPHIMTAANCPRLPTNQRTLWAFRDQVLKNGTLDHMSGRTLVPGHDDQLRQELARVSHQIQSLEKSENERLSRELQAIELNIQETERNLQMHVNKAKKSQEEADYRLAQQIAVEEAQKQRQSALKLK